MNQWQSAKAHYSLGIDIQKHTANAVLLCYQQKQWQLAGAWTWQQPSSAPLSTSASTPTHHVADKMANKPSNVSKKTLLEIVHWQDFLHFLYPKLVSLSPFARLDISLGIGYPNCAWLPAASNSLLEWQRQAASHWQLPASEVLVDILPMNPQYSILVSIPKAATDALIDSLHMLDALSPQKTRIGLETNLSCLYKLWPMMARSHTALVMPTTSTAIPESHFMQVDGLQVSALDKLPKHITNVLFTLVDNKAMPPTLAKDPQASLQVWQWQVKNLAMQYCIAWHLAYQPITTSVLYRRFVKQTQPTRLTGWYKVNSLTP